MLLISEYLQFTADEIPVEKNFAIDGEEYKFLLQYNSYGDFYTMTIKDLSDKVLITNKLTYLVPINDSVVNGLNITKQIIPVNYDDPEINVEVNKSQFWANNYYACRGYRLMAEFYNRVVKLNIEGKLFEYNLTDDKRFMIEFNIDFDIAKLSNSSTIKIYNINDETIELVRPKANGKQKEFKLFTLEAGYKDNFGIVLAGEIYDSKVTKNGVDKILELKCGGNISKFGNLPINKTYNNKNTSYIVKDILQTSGFESGGVIPESEILYTSITIKDLREGLKRLAKDSISELYISNNQIFFKKPDATNEVIKLGFTSGLLQEPEKTDAGYNIKSLFNYRITQGNRILVSAKKDYTLKVVRGKHSFSPIGQSITEFEAIAL
jgi:hypothetical protein